MSRAMSRFGGLVRGQAMPAMRSFTRSSSIVPNSADEFRSSDSYFDYTQTKPTESSWDPTGRAQHYLVMGGARVAYASMGRLAVMKIVGSLSASADVLALGTVEVDLGGMALGTTTTVKWRGKPVFVKHRTPEEIATAVADDNAELKDPEADAERAVNPEWLVLIGICTHLGCVPTAGAGDYGAWFCPCHGSHYDLSGRIRKGPAPLNLEIPNYSINGSTLKLG